MKTYLLRDIDDALWGKFKALSKQRRFSLRVLILDALSAYLAKETITGTNGSDTQNDKN